MKDKILVYLKQRIGSGTPLSDEHDIFKLGLVNSLFALQLVMFLEMEFDIKIENEDLELSNFNTVNNIEQFVSRKQQVCPPMSKASVTRA